MQSMVMAGTPGASFGKGAREDDCAPDRRDPSQRGTSVAHTFRTTLTWRWSARMPRPLGGGFLKVLQSLGALANEDGVLRFRRSGDGIPLGRIANGARCDVKDARRYLRAAMAAGLVGIVGEARKGFAVVYTLLVPGWEPDWAAAVDSLLGSRRKRHRDGSRDGGPEQDLDLDLDRPGWTEEEEEEEEWPAQPSDEEWQFGEDVRGQDPRPGRGAAPLGGEGERPPTSQVVSHGGPQVELPVVDHVQAPRARTRVTREAEERARQWREFTLALPAELRLAAVGMPARHPSRLAAVAAMAERRVDPAELGDRAGRGRYRPAADAGAVLVARLDAALAGPPAPTPRTAVQATAMATARAAVRAALRPGSR